LKKNPLSKPIRGPLCERMVSSDKTDVRKPISYLRRMQTCYNSNMAKGKISTPPGHVNLRMLAEHLELSQTTVSLVLNNSPSAKSIPQETRDRVVAAAERLNYRPNY